MFLDYNILLYYKKMFLQGGKKYRDCNSKKRRKNRESKKNHRKTSRKSKKYRKHRQHGG